MSYSDLVILKLQKFIDKYIKKYGLEKELDTKKKRIVAFEHFLKNHLKIKRIQKNDYDFKVGE